MQGQNLDLRRGMILEHQLLLAQSITSFVKENKNDKRWTALKYQFYRWHISQAAKLTWHGNCWAVTLL